MGRKSLKDIRQKEIIKAFYTVAKKEGVENTSIAKVAKHMNINPSLVLHYFNSRDEMIYCFVEYILERYSNIFIVDGENIDTTEKVIALVDNLFSRKWNKYIDDGVFYSFYAQTFRDKKIKKVYKELHDNLRRLLRQALASACDNNVIELNDIDQTTDVIYVMVDGSYYYLSMFKDKEILNTRLENYRNYTLELLGINRN
jgi:AcrR family transcriptional regulator